MSLTTLVGHRRDPFGERVLPWLFAAVAIVITLAAPLAGAKDHADDQAVLAKLDVDYQRAVEQNDTKTMARILDDSFMLVLGDGSTYTKTDLLKDAASGQTKYEHQIDSDRTIRIWGNTAVVTAKLWAKGIEDGKRVDYFMWFSDTYIRKSGGWSYVFGQASLAMPPVPAQH